MNEINLELIKQRRKEMRLTLKEMAEALGFKDASTYWKYENGVYKFNADQIPVVCMTLKLRVNEVFFDQRISKIAR